MHRRSFRALLVGLLLVAPSCGAPLASAEIFRCVAKNGLPLYQNFPCQFDSLRAMGALLQTQLVQPVPSAPIAQPVVSAPFPQPVASAPAAPVLPRGAVESEPRVGMTPAEIRALLGDPLDVVPDQPPGEPPSEIWRYADKHIRFDANQRVLAIDLML